MDRRAALVHGQGRHDRQLLGRVQCAPDRGPPAAGARRDRHELLDRRPLRRRHALHGRLPPRTTCSTGRSPCFSLLARDRRIRALAGPRWRRDVAGASAEPPQLAGDVWHPASAARRLLEAWLGHTRITAAIQCPVFATGGWMDGYSNAIPRLLAHLTVPRLGLIGAWGHKYGHQAVPVRRSGTSRSVSGGGTTGSRAATPESCASPCSAPSCRRRCRPAATIRSVLAAGWPSPSGPRAPRRPSGSA